MGKPTDFIKEHSPYVTVPVDPTRHTHFLTFFPTSPLSLPPMGLACAAAGARGRPGCARPPPCATARPALNGSPARRGWSSAAAQDSGGGSGQRGWGRRSKSPNSGHQNQIAAIHTSTNFLPSLPLLDFLPYCHRKNCN